MIQFETSQCRTFSPPGQLIDTGGISLHIHCTNPQHINPKLPTVVIEAGCGCPSVGYVWLQESLSRSLRVCSYDRTGLGWSDNGCLPRDAEHIAAQLHKLLTNYGVEGPIILVGHSIAGLYLRVYANRFPKDIVGMVLLDSSHPRQKKVLSVSGFTKKQRLQKYAMATYTALGLAKLYQPIWELKTNSMVYLPDHIKNQLIHLLGFRQSYLTPLLESDGFDLSAEQALEVGDIGDLPLLVITAQEIDKDVPKDIDWNRQRTAWLELQQDLVELSSNGKHKILEGAGHCTLVTKQQYAKQVAQEILAMIDQ